MVTLAYIKNIIVFISIGISINISILVYFERVLFLI